MFDLLYVGYIVLVELCIICFDLDELLWIFIGVFWQKVFDIMFVLLCFVMIELVVKVVQGGCVCVYVSSMEVDCYGFSYIIDIVCELCGVYGLDIFMVWFMGVDQFVGLDIWYGWQDLFEYVYLCVVICFGFDFQVLYVLVQCELDVCRGDMVLI